MEKTKVADLVEQLNNLYWDCYSIDKIYDAYIDEIDGCIMFRRAKAILCIDLENKDILCHFRGHSDLSMSLDFNTLATIGEWINKWKL